MQSFSTDALLLAAQKTFKTRKPFWREFMFGLTIFAAVYLSNRIAAPDSIWISCVLTAGLALVSMFAIDLVYFRKLKPAIIDRLAKIKLGTKE